MIFFLLPREGVGRHCDADYNVARSRTCDRSDVASHGLVGSGSPLTVIPTSFSLFGGTSGSSIMKSGAGAYGFTWHSSERTL